MEAHYLAAALAVLIFLALAAAGEGRDAAGDRRTARPGQSGESPSPAPTPVWAPPSDPAQLLALGARSQRVTVTPDLEPGRWNTLFESEGPGIINHIWFTFPTGDEGLGRRNLIRMFWDGEEKPSVEAPLTDFFGVPFGSSGKGMSLVSRYVVVAPSNALNCYFPMPFARSARIEIFPEQTESGGGFYFQCDYVTFEKELLAQWRDLRFHAQYRFENPGENYGRPYLWLDATGRGVLVGLTLGITINHPTPDSWYHGGGDTIFIDGEEKPSVLHGVGGEDFFGQSWGVRPFQSASIGTHYIERDEENRPWRIGVYRFFVDDPVFFHKSIRAGIGALSNEYTSVAYWYQDEPHTPFFEVPNADARMPGEVAGRGTYDIEPADAPEWKLLAPFWLSEHPFEETEAVELAETGEESDDFHVEYPGLRETLPGGGDIDVRWKPQTACHNFIDFHVVARPALYTIKVQYDVVGYALRYVESDRDREVTMWLGFDDKARVRVNDQVVFEGEHPRGFFEEPFKARLRKGKNRILVKLSNQPNTNWRAWAFSFRHEQ